MLAVEVVQDTSAAAVSSTTASDVARSQSSVDPRPRWAPSDREMRWPAGQQAQRESRGEAQPEPAGEMRCRTERHATDDQTAGDDCREDAESRPARIGGRGQCDGDQAQQLGAGPQAVQRTRTGKQPEEVELGSRRRSFRDASTVSFAVVGSSITGSESATIWPRSSSITRSVISAQSSKSCEMSTSVRSLRSRRPRNTVTSAASRFLVQAGEGLVEDQHSGLGGQQTGQQRLGAAGRRSTRRSDGRRAAPDRGPPRRRARSAPCRSVPDAARTSSRTVARWSCNRACWKERPRRLRRDAQRPSAHGRRALGWVEQPGEDPGQRRLARSVQTVDEDPLAGTDRQVHVVQCAMRPRRTPVVDVPDAGQPDRHVVRRRTGASVEAQSSAASPPPAG